MVCDCLVLILPSETCKWGHDDGPGSEGQQPTGENAAVASPSSPSREGLASGYLVFQARPVRLVPEPLYHEVGELVS